MILRASASSHSLQKETCKDFRESLEVLHRGSSSSHREEREILVLSKKQQKKKDFAGDPAISLGSPVSKPV
jgi:hypothetical protein